MGNPSGTFQRDKAWEYLKTWHDNLWEDIWGGYPNQDLFQNLFQDEQKENYINQSQNEKNLYM